MKVKLMEVVKTFIFIVASIVLGFIIVLAPEICDTVVFFYVSILTGYIGLDIVNMIKTTSILPKDEFKPVKAYRYIVCFIVYFALLIEAGIVQKETNTIMTGFYTVIVSAIFLLASLLIGALEGNKIMNKIKKGKKEDTEK